MADGQKLSGYGIGMSLGQRPRDITMPYPPYGILHFFHHYVDASVTRASQNSGSFEQLNHMLVQLDHYPCHSV